MCRALGSAAVARESTTIALGTKSRQARSVRQLPDNRMREEMEAKSLMIGVLAVAVAVLGYLYWESQQSKVEINVPGVSIKAK